MTGIIGIVVGLVSLILAFVLEGGAIGSLFQPTALLIVFGGTFGAIIASFSQDELKNIGKILKVAFTPRKNNTHELITELKELSIQTRKHGLLSLESNISGSQSIDPFILKGLRMMVDGIEPDIIRTTLELKTENMYERHLNNASIFEAAGGFAPTMGIIGTVLGLVHILGNLSGDPGSLAPLIATAFIATLYGVASANVLWIPIANKLKQLNKQDMLEKELIIEGILLIQSGANPNVIEEQLKSFLSDKEVELYEKSASVKNSSVKNLGVEN